MNNRGHFSLFTFYYYSLRCLLIKKWEKVGESGKKFVSLARIIKGDDIGKGVVLQILYIYFMQILIITKNIVDIACLFTFRFSNTFHPAFYQILIIREDKRSFVKKRSHNLTIFFFRLIGADT